MEAFKCRNCIITCTCTGKNYTSENTSSENPREVSERIRSKRAGPRKQVDLLPAEEEKLRDFDLGHLGLKSDGETQGVTMSKEEDNTPALEKSSNH